MLETVFSSFGYSVLFKYCGYFKKFNLHLPILSLRVLWQKLINLLVFFLNFAKLHCLQMQKQNKVFLPSTNKNIDRDRLAQRENIRFVKLFFNRCPVFFKECLEFFFKHVQHLFFERFYLAMPSIENKL